MKAELYADNTTKTIVRQKDDYESVGLDPNIEIIMPFTAEDDRASIEAKGVNWAGLMRQCNQVYKENLGNSFGAKARAAFDKNETPPGQAEMDELVAAYDFSGARAVSEAGMSEEEKALRQMLRTQLKAILRGGGVFSDEELTVQTVKEANENVLPDGKISVEDFNSLLENAAEGGVFEYNGASFDFGGDPEFDYDDDGNVTSYLNLAAITAHCGELAAEKLAADRRAKAVSAAIPK
jgi:hypothetical protein